MENEFDKYRLLMKDATKYKYTDIEKSIRIIRNAIKVCPSCARFEGFFRLIKYLAKANKHNEVIKEFQNLLNKVNSDYFGEPYISHSEIYLGMSDYFFKEKQFIDALYYSVLSFWNAIVRTSFIGKEKHLKYLLSEQYNYPVINKILSKVQNVNSSKVLFIIRNIPGKYSDHLFHISRLYNATENSKIFLEPPYYDGESYSNRLYRILLKNNSFKKSVVIVKKIDFENHYNVKISPLLQ